MGPKGNLPDERTRDFDVGEDHGDEEDDQIELDSSVLTSTHRHGEIGAICGSAELQHVCEMCETGQRRGPLKDRMEQQAQKRQC